MKALTHNTSLIITQRPAWWFISPILVSWFVLVFVIAVGGGFAERPGGLPIATIIAVALPIAVFLTLSRWQPGVRQFVLNLDLRVLTLLQAWRVVGAVFIGLLAYDLLPGLFAWPAGLGDMAIGVTAPFITIRLLQNAEFARSKAFRIWHWLGLFDFVVALGTGVWASKIIIGFTATTTAPMQVLPLALIPGFLVPLFSILHLAALLQIRALNRQERG